MAVRIAATVAVLLAIPAVLGGRCPAPQQAAGDVEAALPEPFAFGPDSGPLLLSVLDESGQPLTTDRVAGIPQPLRSRVMVVDLAKTPEQRQADRFVYFADLTRPDDWGRFVARPMSRYRRPPAGTTAALAAAGASVVLYSAPWCGFCKQARAYLKGRGVPFVERDVEASAAAGRELDAKLRAAGAAGAGVPVIDVGGQLVLGFDRPRIDEALARLRKTPPAEDAGASGS